MSSIAATARLELRFATTATTATRALVIPGGDGNDCEMVFSEFVEGLVAAALTKVCPSAVLCHSLSHNAAAAPSCYALS